MKKLLLILGTLVVSAVPAGVPIVANASGDSAAVAINTTDGKTVWRIQFHVVRDRTTIVNNANIAFAYSSCTGCQTYAISFQTVLDFNNATVVTPTNQAWAINYLCTSCVSYADATQVVLSTDTPMKFTPQGHQDLASIHSDLEMLRHEDLTVDQLTTAVDSLSAKCVWVVANEMVPA